MNYDDQMKKKTKQNDGGRSALMGGLEPAGFGGSGPQPPPGAASQAKVWWGLGAFCHLEAVAVDEVVEHEAIEEGERNAAP